MSRPDINRTQVLSVHKFRRAARAKERRIQPALEGMAARRISAGIPSWASGVRVEKAGLFSWAVVATERPGH